MATFKSLKLYRDTLPVTLSTWENCERVYGLIGPQRDGFEHVYLDAGGVDTLMYFAAGAAHFDAEEGELYVGDADDPIPTVSINGETYWDFGGWEFERWHGHDYQPHHSRLSGTFSHVCQNCGQVRIGAEEHDFQDPWEDN